MSRRKETFADLLLMPPWWVSAVIGILAYAGLRWVVPIFAGEDKLRQGILTAFSNLAPFIALLFGVLAVASLFFGVRRRTLVDQQQSLETLRSTSWKDFEYLVAEAYRRQGFAVDYSIGKGADGGVDLVLQKSGRTSLVQCKQWKVFSVGAPVVREMFGIMTANGADEVIIVTSGRFTDEAMAFASGKSIQLVDGPKLYEMVKTVQTSKKSSTNADPESSEPTSDRLAGPPQCPRCSKTMVLRTSRRGSKAGERFWGCSSYPACKGTRPA